MERQTHNWVPIRKQKITGPFVTAFEKRKEDNGRDKVTSEELVASYNSLRDSLVSGFKKIGATSEVK